MMKRKRGEIVEMNSKFSDREVQMIIDNGNINKRVFLLNQVLESQEGVIVDPVAQSHDLLQVRFGDNGKAFVNSKDVVIRSTVADKGYCLEQLVNDPHWLVRVFVAKHGYGLETLIHDDSVHVRKAVADQGYDLKNLLYDKSWIVRKAVAEQGYGLPVLMNDESEEVREAVALLGFAPHTMLHDESGKVRDAAQYFKDHVVHFEQ